MLEVNMGYLFKKTGDLFALSLTQSSLAQQ